MAGRVVLEVPPKLKGGCWDNQCFLPFLGLLLSMCFVFSSDMGDSLTKSYKYSSYDMLWFVRTDHHSLILQN